MVVEALARRAEIRRLTVQEVRDGLVSWFVLRGEPQARRGMRYTAPGAGRAEVRRVLHQRARAFFVRLASPWDEPTWSDLRRVKARMESWLLPRRSDLAELCRESELWDLVLLAQPPSVRAAL